MLFDPEKFNFTKYKGKEGKNQIGCSDDKNNPRERLEDGKTEQLLRDLNRRKKAALMRCKEVVRRIIQGGREESISQESSLFHELKLVTEEIERIIEQEKELKKERGLLGRRIL